MACYATLFKQWKSAGSVSVIRYYDQTDLILNNLHLPVKLVSPGDGEFSYSDVWFEYDQI